MPRETFTVSVAMGFLVCLIMIPVSYMVLSAALWIFVFGTIGFFLVGVLSPRIAEDEPLRYLEIGESSAGIGSPGREDEGRPTSASVFSRYYQ